MKKEKERTNGEIEKGVPTTQIKVDNFTAGIIKWKFIIREEMDKYLNCKEMFFVRAGI